MKSEFPAIDWNEPIDVERVLHEVPLDYVMKGFTFNALLSAMKARGVDLGHSKTYLPLRDYPYIELLILIVKAARLGWPGEPMRQGLRQVGRTQFTRLRENRVFDLIFRNVVDRNDLQSPLRIAPRAWAVVSRHEKVSVSELGPRRGVLRFDDAWSFPDCYQVGTIEGGIEFFGAEAEVRSRSLGISSAEI